MTQCLICGSESILDVPQEIEHLYICQNCGYGRPSLRNPIQYDDEYEIKYLAYPEHEICAIRLAFIRKLELLSKSIIDNNILDYGCGSGAFVRYARKYGHNAYGYDINNYTESLRPPLGFSPYLVTAWDSFEHLTDEQQKQFFETAKDAAVIISVPDFESAENVSGWRHYRPREHLHYYTEKSLRKLFENKGYRFVFSSHAEDTIRSAPWCNNILTVGFIK